MNIRSRRRLIATGVAIGVIVMGSAVRASIPDSGTGVISGCYRNLNGTLRVIDAEAGQACSPSELPLTWNQVGPSGAQGPQGPAGPEGPQGPAGHVDTASAVSDVEFPPGLHRRSVRCPAGFEATGGGHQVDGYPVNSPYFPWVKGSGLDLTTDDPLNHPTTWYVEIQNGSATGTVHVRLFVMCINIPSS